MKNNLLLFFSLLLAAASGSAQTLPVRTVTVFKNNKSLIHKSGKVPVQNSQWSTTDLPAALFGTFWVASPTDELVSVFSRQDSTEIVATDKVALLDANIGKPVVLWLNYTTPDVMNGVVEKIEKIDPPVPGYAMPEYRVYLRTAENRWATFSAAQISKIEFLEKPSSDFKMKAPSKKTQETLTVHFKNNKPEQEIGMLYLANGVGWTPVYSLLLAEKGKSRLSLRASVANDTEDLGDAELRLAVGIPNFTFANQPDWLVNFAKTWQQLGRDDYRYSNLLAAQAANYTPAVYSYDEVPPPPPPGDNFESGQAEDFFFYTVRPGNFPKNSRYQYPIFEAEVVPAHFYECELPKAGPGSFSAYYEPRRNANEPKNPVSHYIEFDNPTLYPFTTGAVNILSQSGGATYPLSQDMLPYTPPKAKCKVKIAQTPEIKVTHGEGDVERKDNTFLFFGRNFDEIRVEGQVCAINYKKEPVTLKIRRSIEGTPIASEQKWETKQEQATLRVNPSHEVEWSIELKPGEEKKWKYSYRVYVDF